MKGARMASDGVSSLMEAQLKRDEHLVREWARRLGTNYAFAPDAGARLTECGIDKVELAECLARSVLKERIPMFGIVRYRVEHENSSDPDIRIASVTVCLH